LKLNQYIFISLFLLWSILAISGCTTSSKTVKNQEITEQNKNINIEKDVSGAKKTISNEETTTEKKIEKSTNENKTDTIDKSEKPIKEVKKKVISKEYKQKETNSILNTIEKLEQCYETENFEDWESLLTPDYKAKYNDPVFLKEHGWKANNLKSFFYLLIQTREKNGIKSLPISRVDFVNPNKAYVYVLYKGKEFPKPQHTFIKIGNAWYKGLPEEGE